MQNLKIRRKTNPIRKASSGEARLKGTRTELYCWRTWLPGWLPHCPQGRKTQGICVAIAYHSLLPDQLPPPPPAFTHSWRPGGAAIMFPIIGVITGQLRGTRLCNAHQSTPDPIHPSEFRAQISFKTIGTFCIFSTPLSH